MIPIAGVYMIRNRTNGCAYVGSSVDIARRWEGHLSRLRRGLHGNPRLQQDWLTFGEAAFLVTLLEPVAPVDSRLDAAEKRWSGWFRQSAVPMYSLVDGGRRQAPRTPLFTPGLRRRRLLAALTQEELAERADISRQTVIRLEDGGQAHPPTVRRLADVLGCEPRDLIEPDGG